MDAYTGCPPKDWKPSMKVGDYVYVKDGTHDERMPKGRRDGLVVELVGKRKDQAIVMFSNKAFLKFHLMFLERINVL
jgi:hypothetical protein|tara:strand:+ start:277 stop:507 length:231 start_codon:yes stop_codon:yes gene_type:complete